MQDSHNSTEELVTVIIACFNHGLYLGEAIESILSQTYKNIEIIVVDDGSTDNTKLVAENYPVRYIYQTNKGLSAARNTGIEKSSGLYLIFLDADDWLLPDAVIINYSFLQQNNKAAFVSGAHEKVYGEGKKAFAIRREVTKDHYMHFLMGNYIGMHAAVMYRRWAFNVIKFDISMKACEDYDVYLNISRNHPVIHHTNLIAAYRFHDANMSGNRVKMLNFALIALTRQSKCLLNKEERKCLDKGVSGWKKHYTKFIYAELLQLRNQTGIADKEKITALLKYDKIFYLKYYLKKIFMA